MKRDIKHGLMVVKRLAPNVGNGSNVRNVNMTGAVNNDNSNNSNGVAPDCELILCMDKYYKELGRDNNVPF